MIYDDLNIIFPEIFLSVYAMVALLGVVYTSKDELAKRVTWVTAFIFILVAFLIIFSEEKTEIAFGGMFINDAFSRFSKIIIFHLQNPSGEPLCHTECIHSISWVSA